MSSCYFRYHCFGSGSTSIDIAGYNNTGTHTNGPVPVSAKVLGGLMFDGINDYVEVPDQSELNFGIGDFSFDAWIQTTDSVGAQDLVDKRTSSTGYIGYSFFLNNGKLSLQMADGSFTSYASPVFVADGQWHHIAITVSRTDSKGIHFYLDGVDTQFGDPTLHPGSLNNKGPLRIGSQSFSVNYLFKGVLDEIELFNRVLSATEIQTIYNAGSAGKCKSPVTGIKRSSQIPNEFTLSQNFPNPFNPSTIIRYDIPKTSFVKISVYDILGREIRVLVNEEKGPGQYNVVFDANNLTSGIYFYRLRVNDYVETKKMLLIK